MKKLAERIIKVAAVAVVLGVLFPAHIFAQSNQGDVYKSFAVSPGKVEIELNPGEEKTVNLEIFNNLGEKKTFQIEVEDVAGSEDPEKTVVLLGDDKGPYSLKDYIVTNSQTVSLENGERKNFPVTVKIPADAEPGGLYGSVLVGTVSNSDQNGGSSIVSRLGSLFFVKVSGPVNEKGSLKEFSKKNNSVMFRSEPIEFRILYENSGSVHLNPYGEIRIKNIIGEEVGSLWIDPWYALPDSVRSREVKWETPFLFGRYTAIVSINRGYDDIIDTAHITFWVLPWKVLLIVFVLITIAIAALRFVWHKVRRSN